MKITILKPYGYCAGVKRAISLALKTKQLNKDKNVVVLGMLVHNEEALKTLYNAGIKMIFDENSSLEELANKIKEPSIVILTAHGHSKKVEEILTKNGHKLIDTTCPFVNKTKNIINKELSRNNDVLYLGVNGHPEAKAVLTLGKQVYLIDVNNPKIPYVGSVSPLVISQTTLSFDEIKEILVKIKDAYPEARFSKGICDSSTERQNALKRLKNDVDGILIVGDKKSNNTKTLYNLSKSLYPNILIKMVSNFNDINKKDLKGHNHIVLSSGASTPDSIIEEIKNKLSN